MTKSKTVILTGLTLIWASPVFAHGGGLNAQGCHTNRKTGDYHCHRSVSPPPPPPSRTDFDRTPPQTNVAAEEVTAPFANCTAARAAGAAPVYLGQPGYGSHLDRDGDGIGCE
ncbi:MAG: excalibur calcium-binding domain-containing protein [Acidobacteria bacterium]|nr:excalibur calcium-binding domain-containing protein [Acidobacteriota bacterium]